jgi:hypothetical protein
MISLVLWSLSLDDLTKKLNNDELPQSDVTAVASLYTRNQVTSGTLFDFTSFGQPIPQSTLLSYFDASLFDAAASTYTVIAATGTTAGQGGRMIKALRLDPTSTNTNVVLDANSATLDYEVHLTNLAPLQVPVGDANITLDWSKMQVNAMGNSFAQRSIDHVMVAKYSLTPQELESRFLDIQSIADDMWSGSIDSGTSVVFSSLNNAAGTAFGGIDGSHTWIVALVCGTCQNPAPWYLSVLTPCAG